LKAVYLVLATFFLFIDPLGSGIGQWSLGMASVVGFDHDVSARRGQ
jgi:hypothetical protein